MHRRILIFCWWLWMFSLSQAQEPWSTLRQKTMVPTGDWQLLDSLTVFPHSVKVRSTAGPIPLDSFYLLRANRDIKFMNFTTLDTFQISYRVFGVDLAAPLFRIDTAEYRKRVDGILKPYDPFVQNSTLPDFGKLQYNGTFSRGITFGNNQNLVLNSNLNLQMTGRLTNDMEVLASITDSSIPLQPEGNTAQLQEFDQVFVQLRRKESALTAGDYELLSPDRYFMRYFKKLQGASASTRFGLGKGEMISKTSAAISRGKFARNILNPQEGNQGPYRLSGNEGERFIIILAGTERVFLDGALLQRGLQADYVIDYNAANITFTANRLVTKDSRIVVEFDYTDLGYLRSLAAADLDYKFSRARIYFSAYSDQDGKNSFAEGDLSDADKKALREAGDGEAGALVSGLEPLEEFNPLRVTYEIVDTVLCGIPDSILVFSTNPDKARYTARFTEVGAGNGNYVLEEGLAANGRVYRWVAPVNCRPSGNYAPLIQLLAPRQQQLFTLGTDVDLARGGQIKGEVALSRLDQNRFSSLDKDDDWGIAGYTGYAKTFRLSDPSQGWTMKSDLKYEFVQPDFTFISPYRPQEFSRDWNLSQTVNGQLGNSDLPKARENLVQAQIELAKAEWGSLAYRLTGFWRAANYSGNRHFTRLTIRRPGLDAFAEGDFLQSSSSLENTRFFKPKAGISKKFGFRENQTAYWHLGIEWNKEFNERRLPGLDSLSASSFSYDFLRFFAERQEGKNLNSRFQASRRWDFLPEEALRMVRSSIADEVGWNGEWRQKGQSSLSWNLTYRNLKVGKASQIAPASAESYLGRINYNLALWKGALRSVTAYEVGSGQEPRIEFNYLRVNPGEGVYQWNDYNDDGVAQQNEFEIAVFQDSAAFIRVSAITNEFIRSNNVVFNQSLQLEPKALWYTSSGWRKGLSRFSVWSSWQINRRVKEAKGVSPWNPFQLQLADTALVALNSNVRNTLFFNRADPVYDVQLGWNNTENRVVITTGFESRSLQESLFQTRWNLSRAWTLKVLLTRKIQENNTENFQNRNFKIEQWGTEPSVVWQVGASLRSILTYSWSQSENLAPGGEERARSRQLSLESSFNFAGSSAEQRSTAIRAKGTFASVDFSGIANSPVGFAMLDGLRSGRNFLWSLSADRQLLKNIRLGLTYDGRKTGATRVVHIGRVQVAAVF